MNQVGLIGFLRRVDRLCVQKGRKRELREHIIKKNKQTHNSQLQLKIVREWWSVHPPLPKTPLLPKFSGSGSLSPSQNLHWIPLHVPTVLINVYDQTSYAIRYKNLLIGELKSFRSTNLTLWTEQNCPWTGPQDRSQSGTPWWDSDQGLFDSFSEGLFRKFPAVQWLGLCASTARPVVNPGQGTKILQVMQCGQKRG